jgi:hypothetical protein
MLQRAGSNQKSEVRDRKSDDRWFKVVNIEQQNKEPQNVEVITSIFDIPCSIFCGSKRRQLRGSESDWFSPGFWLLTPSY